MRLINADAFLEEARNKLDMQDVYLPIHIKELVIDEMPTIDAVEVVRCKDCRWFDKKTEHSSYGYCHAMKHDYFSKNWEISIYRTQKEDFYCADGEKKTEVEE